MVYVTSQLRKFNAHTRSLVKHQINNILFETEVGIRQAVNKYLHSLQTHLLNQSIILSLISQQVFTQSAVHTQCSAFNQFTQQLQGREDEQDPI